jgi:hypothetical protein
MADETPFTTSLSPNSGGATLPAVPPSNAKASLVNHVGISMIHTLKRKMPLWIVKENAQMSRVHKQVPDTRHIFSCTR